MKNQFRKTVFTLFICFFFATLMTAQTKSTKDLPVTYESEKDTIYKLYKGDVVHVTLDSVYLFNQKRYNDVVRLMSYRDFIRNKDPMAKAFSTVWESHSKSLDSLEKYINVLKENAEKTSKTGEILAENTIKITKAAETKLDSVNQKLTIAQNKLDSANMHLDSAVKLIKLDIRWRWLKNAALVAIGVLLGYLAAK
jgi:tRNA U34 5-carboxymethylaminomethyl modifying GTPase MnmE/TrmE